MNVSSSELDTRNRLIEVAGSIFAKKGFRAATIREICDQAGANLAAVNYHFRDKEGLYEAVLGSTIRTALERYPADGGVSREAPVEQRLEGVVRAFLQRTLSLEQPPWKGCLMARELAEPSGALPRIIQEVARPVHEVFTEVVADLAPEHSEEQRWLCVQSIVAQCHFFRHAESVLELLRPEWGQLSVEERIDRLTEHITKFTLAGLGGAR